MKYRDKPSLIARKKLISIEIPQKFLTQLSVYNITIDEYLVLYAQEQLDYSLQDLATLPLSKSIEEVLTSISIKQLDLYKNILFNDDLSWVEDWVDLWPQGVKQNGVYVRSSVSTIKEHFKRFFKKYDYTKEEIFQATKAYLANQAKSNNNYISLSHNFIEKSNVSLLANMCETCKNGEGTENYKDAWTDRA